MTSNSQYHGHRASFANRMSTLFERRRAPAQDADSARATTTFEVPLFLSPSRYQPPQATDDDLRSEATRSRSSTRSLIEAAASVADRVRPLTLQASSRYSSPVSSPNIPQSPVLPRHEPSPSASIRSSERRAARPRARKVTPRRQRRRRRTSLRVQIQSLTRICVAFGITLLATLITYLVLAVTGTAVGIMFHVLMILLILSLTGVFAHSGIRLFILSKSAKDRRSERRRVDRWHGQTSRQHGSYFGELYPEEVEHYDEHPPEKPIHIIMAEDEEKANICEKKLKAVKAPPPVYGNFRTSKRINPDLVHWQKVPPSPLTPTYDEAMSDIHRAVGYRPPSYIESDSGATHIVERGKRDVDRALQNIHPLERERIAELAHNAI